MIALILIIVYTSIKVQSLFLISFWNGIDFSYSAIHSCAR